MHNLQSFYAGICFDMDGVLTDTVPFHDEAWRLFAREHLGLDLAPNDPRVHTGTSVEILMRLAGVSREQALRMSQTKEAMFKWLATGRLRPLPGLSDYLAWLDQHGIPTALVTNAPLENVDFTLAELGLESAFDHIIAAEHSPQGKPDPTPYLIGARQLGLAPGDCLVHEDSAAGIRAATLAGMDVAALRTTLSGAELSELGAKWSSSDYRQWLSTLETWQ
ncbi:HAD family phosphatase [Chitinivorax sp. PXF-14]|uniref:HAD family hydrolase n=1 Tax=Chitinivorax sp. PXF-14 TaxID=3230488 RepID=UPI0034651BB1